MHSRRLRMPVWVMAGKPNGHLTPVTQLPVSAIPLLSCLAADKAKKHSLYLTRAASASLKTSQAEMIVQKFFCLKSPSWKAGVGLTISGASKGRSCGCWVAPVAAELGMVDEGSAGVTDTLVCCCGCFWASNILLCVRLASRLCPTSALWPDLLSRINWLFTF